MATTDFSTGTVIEASWLNDVDNATYTDLPQAQADILTEEAARIAADLTKVAKTADTGSAVLPSGTTAQRDGTPVAGYTRFNSDYAKPEVYNGTGWSGLGGADGTGGDAVFYVNDNTIDNAYTLAAGKNAHSVGPITINAAVTLNGRWVIS